MHDERYQRFEDANTSAQNAKPDAVVEDNRLLGGRPLHQEEVVLDSGSHKELAAHQVAREAGNVSQPEQEGAYSPELQQTTFLVCMVCEICIIILTIIKN